MKKYIYDLAVNNYDTQIAIVENQGMYNSVQESVVRLYDVGRRRDDEDEQVQQPQSEQEPSKCLSDLIEMMLNVIFI